MGYGIFFLLGLPRQQGPRLLGGVLDANIPIGVGRRGGKEARSRCNIYIIHYLSAHQYQMAIRWPSFTRAHARLWVF
jgi:hypothetical protein